MNDQEHLVTLAIRTYEQAQIMKGVLENEGIPAVIQNVNLVQPVISSGVRVRIRESDLPHALEILEKYPIFDEAVAKESQSDASVPVRSCVLIPVDFSEYSFEACRIGFEFAFSHDADVFLLHTFYVTDALSVSFPDAFKFEVQEKDLFSNEMAAAREDMEKLVKRLNECIDKEELPRVVFSYKIVEGIPEEVIESYTEREKPILVVMGTRGKDRKETDLIGSVTAEVLDSSRCPVLAIPEDSAAHLSQLREVAFFTNFEQRDLVSIDAFVRLFGQSHFSLTFVYLAKKPDRWNEIKLAGMRDYCSVHYPGYKFDYVTFDENQFLEQVEMLFEQRNIEMMVIPNRRRGLFARLFNPSIAHKMLFHADTPLLMIPS
mgnify:CR=1 FL=1